MVPKIVSYLIESSLLMAVLYGVYFFVFRQYKNFLFNRAYLLIALLFAILVPTLSISLLIEAPVAATANLQQAIRLPEVIISAAGDQASSRQNSLDIGALLGIIYLTGFSALLIRFLYRVTRLLLFIRASRHKASYRQFYHLIPTEGKISTCSFFNYLLWDNSQEYVEAERQLIIAHEETHIRQRHSYDVVFAELIMIFFWFNPIAYLYRNSLSAVHEYIADQRAASVAGISPYLSLLSLRTLKALNLTLGNNFHQTQIFKRMTMLKTEKRRSWWSRMALTLPVFALLFYAFACEQNGESSNTALLEHELPSGMQMVDVDGLPPEINSWFAKNLVSIRGAESNTESKVFAAMIDNGDLDLKGSHFHLRQVFRYQPNGQEEKIYAIVEHSDEINRYGDVVNTSKEDEVFTEVEDIPQPDGGMTAFYTYVMQNMTYPAQARNEGVEGRVFVQFVVDETGKVMDAEAIKGIGGGCDEEAVRVVSGSPLWTPGKKDGKNVKVKMILPITFTLGKEAPKTSTKETPKEEAKTSAKNLEELVVVGH